MQGNVPIDFLPGDPLKDIAVGGFKPSDLTQPLPDENDALGVGEIFDQVFNLVAGGLPGSSVTSDPNRRLLSRQQFVQEHFNTAGLPVGHGFTNGIDRAYYAVPAQPDDLLQFICLDTTKAFGADGTLDADQLNWLETELRKCHSRYEVEVSPGEFQVVHQPHVRDRLVVIFCHHTLDSIDSFWGWMLKKRLLLFPNVILLVDGHTHRNSIKAHPRQRGFPGGFWEVTTASHIDWPIQSRVIEVTEGDGTLSIFTTMVDIDAPLHFGGDLGDARQLASLARELAANDPQEVRATGEDRRRGTPADRNAQLLLPTPFELPIRAPRVAAASDAFEQVNVFAANDAGQVFGRRELGVWQGWTPYLQFDSQARVLAAESHADGSIELFEIRDNDQLWSRRGNVASPTLPAPIWSPWRPHLFSGAAPRSLATARNADGRMDLYLTDRNHRVWSRSQAAPNSGNWSDWVPLDGTFATVAAERNADGRITLFGLTRLGRPYQRTQTAPNSWFGGWSAIPGSLSSLAVARAADGRLNLFGSNHLGQVLHAAQTSPGADSWSAWSQLDLTAFVVSVAASTIRDGRLDVYARTSTGLLFSRRQAVTGQWDGWWEQFPWLVPATVAVPDVITKTQAEADGYLQSHLGFFRIGTVTEVLTPHPSKFYRVISQTPVAGTHLSVGSPVHVRIGKPKPIGGF